MTEPLLPAALPLAGPAPGPARRRGPGPGAWAFGVLLLAFGAVAYAAPYPDIYYDSKGYWIFGGYYWRGGRFAFESYDACLRGYLWPLVLSPLVRLSELGGQQPLAYTRPLGALGAAALFGVAAPAYWRAVFDPAGPPVGLGRRLVLGAAGLAVWGQYAVFPLTDMPALVGLLLAVVGARRARGPVGGLLTGLALGAALNLRPVFVAALPLVGLLAAWPALGRAGAGRRRTGLVPAAAIAAPAAAPVAAFPKLLGLLLGLALVLGPQWWVNHRHFGVESPLVLTAPPGAPSVYLEQLRWGLENQKYESNVGTDYPERQVFFRDPAGRALLVSSRMETEPTAANYLALAAQHPLALAGVWARHLFNGLDVQYPTPYIRALYVPTWPLAALNYTLLLGGALALGQQLRRRAGPAAPRGLALAALLLPCLLVLPTAIECRFLLPLHVLLLAALACGAHPRAWWVGASAGRRLGLAVLLAGGLLGAFALSAATQQQLAEGPRYLFEWQRPAKW